ncbi:tetratricopeptide repeat protein [Aliihoeflea sp. PC F10.4]
MSDESFFREINQELRQDRARHIWDRYGLTAIGIGLAIVLAAGIYVTWDWWQTRQANESGDRFSQALTLANEGNSEEALTRLSELEADGHGAYPVLARLRAATVQANAGDFDDAVASFDAVAADSSIPQSIRDAARLRSGYLLVDHGSYDDVASRVEALTSDDNSMRHSAREALALAAWGDGQSAEALRLFDLILEDERVSANMRQRAQLMSELIRGTQEPS